jgi:hypothetical protein
MFPPVESQVIFLSKETPIVSVDLRTAEVSYTNQNKTAWKSEVVQTLVWPQGLDTIFIQPVLTCKRDWGRIRPMQILWSIALKLQIGKDDGKKESKYQKYIY